MIEIKECSKSFGTLQAVSKVSLDIRAGWKQWRRKEYTSSDGSRDIETGRRRDKD